MYTCVGQQRYFSSDQNFYPKTTQCTFNFSQGYVFTCVRLLACMFVCQQDYTKTTEQISTKLGWKMVLGPEQTPLTFGVVP